MTSVIKIHPIKAIIKAIIFLLVIFSLKNIADIIITKKGAVYNKIAATDRVVSSIVIK